MACLMEGRDDNDECGPYRKENSISRILASTVFCTTGVWSDFIPGTVAMVYAYGALFEYGWFFEVLEVGNGGTIYIHCILVLYKY